MSTKVLKRTIYLFLGIAMAGLLWHMLRLPHQASAKPARPPALTFQGGSGDTPATAVMIAGAPDYVAVVAG
jgi:hypothetical protein